MADVLKSLPFMGVEEYLWGHSSSFIKLMAYDQSRIKYLKNKEGKEAKQDIQAMTAEDVFTNLGIKGARKDAATVKGDIRDLIRNSQQKKDKKV